MRLYFVFSLCLGRLYGADLLHYTQYLVNKVSSCLFVLTSSLPYIYTMLNTKQTEKMSLPIEHPERFTIWKDESGMWGARPMWSLIDNKYGNQATTVFDLKRDAKEGIQDIINDKTGCAYMSTFGQCDEYYNEYYEVL